MVIATQNDPSIRMQRLADIFQWVEEGKITPYVSHTFLLTDVKEAMRAKWNGKIIGGAAIRP